MATNVVVTAAAAVVVLAVAVCIADAVDLTVAIIAVAAQDFGEQRAMTRKRSTPVSRPLPARAAAAVRKGMPHSLAVRLAKVRRQRVTSATVRRVAAGEALSREHLQLTTTYWVVRTPFTFLQIGGNYRKSAPGMLFAPTRRSTDRGTTDSR